MSEAILDTSARIKRIPAPIMSPGSCIVCGKAQHDLGFASTDNLDIEFYGTIYFCADCVGDYARIFGYMSRDEISELLAKQKSMQEELEILRSSVVNLENILDAYSKLHSDSRIPSHRIVSDVIASEISDAGTGEQSELEFSAGEGDVNSVTSIAPESVDAGEGEDSSVNESSNEQRRDDVHDSSESNVIDLFKELGL